MQDRVVGVTGQIQRLDRGSHVRQALGQGPPVHVRHHHVGHQQVDLPGMAARDGEGLGSAPCDHHSVPPRLKRLFDDLAHRVFVLGDQHRLGAVERHRRLGRRRLRLRGVDPRQVDLEARALSHFAVQPDVSAALLHRAVHRSEAQPGSLADGLGREERLEDPGLGLRVHPRPRIGDGQHDVAPRGNGDPIGGILGVEIDVLCFDREASTIRHRITRVHREIHDDLLELARVGLHGPAIGCDPDPDRHVLAQQTAQQLFQLQDEFVQAQHLGRHHLLAAEREQLPRQHGGPLRRAPDVEQAFAIGIVRLHVLEHQVGRAQDRGQEIVEVVRHSGRETPYGLHLLRLAELLLEPLSLRHVVDHDLLRPPAGKRDSVTAGLHLDERPVLPAMPPRTGVVIFGGHGLEVSQQGRDILGRTQVLDAQRQELVARVPVMLDRGAVHRQHAVRLQVEDPHGIRCALEHRAVLGFRRP